MVVGQSQGQTNGDEGALAAKQLFCCNAILSCYSTTSPVIRGLLISGQRAPDERKERGLCIYVYEL